MKLKATRLEYRFEDDSGYGFDVVATLEPKKGWSAAVAFDAHGYITAEDAIQHLRHAAEAFLRQLKERGP
jgi:hypothetical protein